jgi:hypothetical protein
MSAAGAKMAAVITRTRRACIAVFLALQLSPAAAANAGGWSAPRTLGSCVAAIGPRVAFPSESPSRPTGPGAVVWAADPRCPAASQPAAFALSEAALGRDDRPATVVQPVFDSAATALDAVGASRGRVAVAAMRAGSAPTLTLTQGKAPTALPAASLPATGELFSLARAYLGDAALATVEPGQTIAVRVERWFGSAFASPQRIPIGAAAMSALVATMDYRSDVLVAWQQNGAIYARMLRASGRTEPTQRVGPSAPNPQLRALVSDNDHGMIAWSSAEGSSSTSVRIAFSDAGVRFRGSRLVASFADPQGAARTPGSLALARLSTENVMLAWTDTDAGNFVVRAAPAVFAGTRPATLLSDPRSHSVLAGLAAGAAGEAVVLWRSDARGSPPGAAREELWAARTTIERHGRVGSRAAEVLAPAIGSAGVGVAVDPASDRAVAAWLTPGAHPSVEYAIGPGALGYRPRSLAVSATQTAGASHPYRIALAAAAAAAIAAVTLLVLRRRARARRGGGAGEGTAPRR